MIDDKKFFAIRGYIKSGTNWLCRILNLHPEISGVGEFHWNRISAQLIQTYRESQNLSDQPELLDQTWLSLDRFIKESIVLACDPQATWVGDRTPSHIEPSVILGARVFNMIRDGRDIMVSASYHFFNNPNSYPQYAESESIQRRLKYFRADPQYFRNHPSELLCPELIQEFASNWVDTLTVNRDRIGDHPNLVCMEVRYEDLHRDTEGVRKKLYEFLDVDPLLAAPLEHNTKAGFEKERPDQFLRKGSVGDWRNYFTAESKDAFDQIAGQTLLEFGYEQNLNYPIQVKDSDAFHSETSSLPSVPANVEAAPKLSPVLPNRWKRRKKKLNSNGYLDAINHEGDMMIVQGWMMLEDGAPDSVAVVSPGGQVYEASRFLRTDLVPYYPEDSSVEHAGYEAVVPRSEFRKRSRYEFSIVATRNSEIAFECKVVKKRADLEGLTGGPFMTNDGVLKI